MASRTGKKPGASFKPNRPNARSSWTVSRNPSRQAAREAKLSRHSVGLARSSAARKSSAEIRRDRQPAHHRTTGSGGLHWGNLSGRSMRG